MGDALFFIFSLKIYEERIENENNILDYFDSFHLRFSYKPIFLKKYT